MLKMLIVITLVFIIFLLSVYEAYLVYKFNRFLKSHFKPKLMETHEFVRAVSWLDHNDSYHGFEVDKTNPSFKEIDKSVKKQVRKIQIIILFITISFITIFLLGFLGS